MTQSRSSRGQQDAHLNPVEPRLPFLLAGVGLQEGAADAVFRDDAPEPQRFRADGVASQLVDVRIADHAVEDGHQKRPHDVVGGRGVGTGIAQGGTAQERGEEAGLAEELGKGDDAGQAGHLALAVPAGDERARAASQEGGVWALTGDGKSGRFHGGGRVHGAPFAWHEEGTTDPPPCSPKE
jgi:hypothetical protein